MARWRDRRRRGGHAGRAKEEMLTRGEAGGTALALKNEDPGTVLPTGAGRLPRRVPAATGSARQVLVKPARQRSADEHPDRFLD